MKYYNIIIKNAVGCEVYNEFIEAENENKALKIILDKVIICEGDTISVEEV